MYRLTLETLLGLELKVDRLHLNPSIPDHWPEYKIHYRYRETMYHITVKRSGELSQQIRSVRVDGGEINGYAAEKGIIPLVDDRQDHYVQVELGS